MTDKIRDALAELEQAEAHYTLTFQISPHPGHIDVGRAWDRMSKAGDKARAVLAESEAVSNGWVSVSERMPQSGVTVLACYTNSAGNVRRIRAEWVAAKTIESGTDSEIGEYDESTDGYYDPEGWYEKIDNWPDYSSVVVNEGEITHWMPLPSPPTQPTQQWPRPDAAEKVGAAELSDGQLLDWIECRAMNGEIQIARSIMGTGYEIAVIERGSPTTVKVYSGTLRIAIDRALRGEK